MSQNIQQLLSIMKTLRDPQNGCPWDLKQDFASIAPYTIEEAYEVADAIEQGEHEELCDELGDLLLQVVFHSQMAEEQDIFHFDDVVAAICDKMVRRHPHVFNPGKLHGDPTDDQSLRLDWEDQKAAERAGKGLTSVLDGVPRGMAEIQRGYKLQKRAASTGFDWACTEQVLAKLQEETAELEQAVAENDRAGIEDELGDLFFTVINLARQLEVDPARSLRAANGKFERRFRELELLAGGKQTMLSMSLEEMEEIWQKVKVLQSGQADGEGVVNHE